VNSALEKERAKAKWFGPMVLALLELGKTMRGKMER